MRTDPGVRSPDHTRHRSSLDRLNHRMCHTESRHLVAPGATLVSSGSSASPSSVLSASASKHVLLLPGGMDPTIAKKLDNYNVDECDVHYDCGSSYASSSEVASSHYTSSNSASSIFERFGSFEARATAWEEAERAKLNSK